MKPEFIVALDLPNITALEKKLEEMPSWIEWYKVGLELFCAEGPACLEPLRKRNKKIFLDLKLHDIPRTVARAVRTISKHGVNMLTVHATGGRAMLEAAAEAAAECAQQPSLLAVTTLTSLDQADLTELGIRRRVDRQVLACGKLALESGIDGVVSSVQEAAQLRSHFEKALLVTPGIRLPDDATGDQKRVATPADAKSSGATHLVIGRSITQASNPTEAAEKMRANMETGRAPKDK